jgi:hypothetical protein
LIALIFGKYVQKIIDWLLLKMFNLEALSGMDTLFLYDKKGMPCNVSCLFTTSKFKFEDLKAYLIQELSRNIPRATSKLT